MWGAVRVGSRARATRPATKPKQQHTTHICSICVCVCCCSCCVAGRVCLYGVGRCNPTHHATETTTHNTHMFYMCVCVLLFVLRGGSGLLVGGGVDRVVRARDVTRHATEQTTHNTHMFYMCVCAAVRVSWRGGGGGAGGPPPPPPPPMGWAAWGPGARPPPPPPHMVWSVLEPGAVAPPLPPTPYGMVPPWPC